MAEGCLALFFVRGKVSSKTPNWSTATEYQKKLMLLQSSCHENRGKTGALANCSSVERFSTSSCACTSGSTTATRSIHGTMARETRVHPLRWRQPRDQQQLSQNAGEINLNHPVPAKCHENAKVSGLIHVDSKTIFSSNLERENVDCFACNGSRQPFYHSHVKKSRHFVPQ